MKKFAFYLPQFHEIKENNEWWGKGFTEWVNVKKAKPLYKGHIQPQVPVNGYYNLLEKKTIINQTKLMNDYGIDGLIYYHYYFEGKKLLEKPAENLLKWKDINQKFFFCWANHDWCRSWNNSKEILIKQTYGNEIKWEEHFKYLLKFFKDERYEKKDNKPLFMLFNTKFEEKEKMIEYFNKRCKEEGFNGICVIESYSGQYINNYELFEKDLSPYSSYVFQREPMYSQYLYKTKIKYSLVRIINKIKSVLSVRIYNGDTLLKLACNNLTKNNKIIHGLCFEWDNTPRHGKRGYVITPITKKMFEKYMSLINDEEYLFINAWNEWAEGMMLEPTQHNGYKYLEWLKEWSENE